MSTLWVPPQVSKELRAETNEYRGELMARAGQKAIIDKFNPELRAIDPHLQMLWFDEGVDLVGVVPARFHLCFDRGDAPPTLEPLCTPDGGYMEPNSGVFEWLRQSDMWNASVKRDRERAKERARQAAERAREREREDLREELKDRWNAAFRTSVSMTDQPWTQNRAGRRGKKAA